MSIVTGAQNVRALYAEAAEKGWVLPCFCSENLTTTEAVFMAVRAYAAEHGIRNPPVIIAITRNYAHRSQTVNFTRTKDTGTGLRLFMAEVEALAGKGGYFEDLRVMIHLDHIQYDTDADLLGTDLSGYSSVMYDASALPFEKNIALTARFVEQNRTKLVIEGACDEIFDAGGQTHNEITTPENAAKYFRETGVDLIVANLGTEHRASAKTLKYESEAARKVKAAIGGANIVLHGTSSVPNTQVRNLFSDGICKVNIWTALERDSAPVLLADMVRNASLVAGPGAVKELVRQGYLTAACDDGRPAAQTHFTNVYREDIIFAEMKRIAAAYLEMWYR